MLNKIIVIFTLPLGIIMMLLFVLSSFGVKVSEVVLEYIENLYKVRNIK